MGNVTRIVLIPQQMVERALAVVADVLGPEVQTGEYTEGDTSWPTVQVGDAVHGHFHGEGPAGIRFVTNNVELADRIEGFISSAIG